MAKAKKETVVEVEPILTMDKVVEPKIVTYTHKAFSIIESKDGRFKVVEVDYNFDTHEAKVAKVTDYARDRALAREDFKIRVAKGTAI